MQVYPSDELENEQKLIESTPKPIEIMSGKQQQESVETTARDYLSKRGLLYSDSKSSKSIKQRVDTFGNPIIRKSKKHHINFSSNLFEIHQVENWKTYNIIVNEEEEKEICCHCCFMF